LPTIVKFPKAFIPTFVGIAANNDAFCDNLLERRLLIIFSSPVAREVPVGMREIDTVMELVSGLLMIKSGQQATRFQKVLAFLLQQAEFLAFGGGDPDDATQIQFNLKLACVFAQSTSQIVHDVQISEKYKLRTPSSLDDELVLNFSTIDVKNLISFGRLLNNQSQTRAVVSLVVFLLNLPKPFTNRDLIDFDAIASEEMAL